MKKTKPKLTTEQFVERAKNTHGTRYNYSKTKMNGTSNKVTITCLDHGDFNQLPHDHLRGSGCRGCAGNKKLTTRNFIERASVVHDYKYDYSNVDYKNIKTKVDIVCKEHGIFSQTPTDHIHSGYGCPVCGGTKPVTTKEFIQRSQDVHGNRYDYSRTNIMGMNIDTTIICERHGKFDQRPADHVNGVGCPICSLEFRGVYNETFFSNNPEKKNLPAIFYVVDGKIGGIQFCKIGVTIKTVKQRFSGKCGIDDKIEIATNLYDAWKMECEVLTKLNDSRFRYQNLRTAGFIGWTECFSLNLKKDILNIVENFELIKEFK
jgi:hypothetical protein